MLPEAVLEGFELDKSSVKKLSIGLINQSFRVRTHSGQALIVQRLHPGLDVRVNRNLRTLTEHLQAKGRTAPRLAQSTLQQDEIVTDNAIWRAMTQLDGRSYDRPQNPEMCLEGARALAEFHRDVSDLGEAIVVHRPPVHRPEVHFKALRQGQEKHSAHTFAAELREAIAPLSALRPEWTNFWQAPSQVVHGDPKFNNLLFDQDLSALCWIDYDTITQMPPLAEWGDAIRSWCNAHDEDSLMSEVDPALFAATLEGMHAAGFDISAREAARAGMTIACELACRFGLDVLNEAYFAHDPTRFERPATHNLQRTRAQVCLAESFWQLAKSG